MSETSGISTVTTVFQFEIEGFSNRDRSIYNTVSEPRSIVSTGVNSSVYFVDKSFVRSNNTKNITGDELPHEVTITYSSYGVDSTGLNPITYIPPLYTDSTFELSLQEFAGKDNFNITDKSASNQTVTPNGDSQQSSFTPYQEDLSVEFEADETITIGASPDFAFGTNNFTIETWVKPSVSSFYLLESSDDLGVQFGYNIDAQDQGLVLGKPSQLTVAQPEASDPVLINLANAEPVVEPQFLGYEDDFSEDTLANYTYTDTGGGQSISYDLGNQWLNLNGADNQSQTLDYTFEGTLTTGIFRARIQKTGDYPSDNQNAITLYNSTTGKSQDFYYVLFGGSAYPSRMDKDYNGSTETQSISYDFDDQSKFYTFELRFSPESFSFYVDDVLQSTFDTANNDSIDIDSVEILFNQFNGRLNLIHFSEEGVISEPTLPQTEQRDTYAEQTNLLIKTNSVSGLQNNTFVDRSTNAHTVTTSGTPVQTAFHPYLENWSVEFNNSALVDTAAVSPSHFGSWFNQDYTIEMWLNPSTFSQTANNGSPCVGVCRLDSSSEYWSFGVVNGGVIRFYYYNGSPITFSTTDVISQNQWTHIAFTHRNNDNSIRIYINGNLSSTGSITGVPFNSAGDSTNKLTIGSGAGGTRYNGYISNLRIIAGTELTSFETTGPLSNVTNTVLLTNQSNRFIDNGGSTILTVNGTPKVTSRSPFPNADYNAKENKGSVYATGDSSFLNVTGGSWLTLDSDFDISFWYYSVNLSTERCILLSTYHGASNGWLLGSRPEGTITLNLSGDGVDLTTSSALRSHNWHHIRFSRDSGVVKIHVDGVEVGSLNNSSTYTYNNSLVIGNLGGNRSGYTNIDGQEGYISDLVFKKSAPTTYDIPVAPVNSTDGELYLPFDNPGVYDTTGNTAIQLSGDTSSSNAQTKYSDTAVYFDGNGDYVDFYNPNLIFNSGDWTIEGWVYRTSTSSMQNFFGAQPPHTTIGISLNRTGAGDTYVYIGNGGSWQALPAINSGGNHPVTVNTWHHIALVKSGNTLTLYHDGNNVGTSTTLPSGTTGYGRIGAYELNGGAGEYFGGYIEDFRITTGIARYTSTFTPPDATLYNFIPAVESTEIIPEVVYGSTISFVVDATDLADGDSISYAIQGVTSADINGDSLTGTTTVSNAQAVVNVETSSNNSVPKQLLFTATYPDGGTATQSVDLINPPASVLAPIETFLWGGGGGGGTAGGWSYGATGGAGGAATGTLIPNLNTPLYITVAGGGQVNSTTSATGGGGIASRTLADNRYGSGGGGFSGIFTGATSTQSNAVIIAGGGGGGGSSRAGTGNAGGAGGGIEGEIGYSPYGGEAYAGKPGTQTAAGAVATSVSANTGNFATALQGGTSPTNSYGGAGGGGYWGGNGGGYAESNTMGGGGGGSGYYNPSLVADAVLYRGTGTTPGNNSSTYRGSAGDAGAVASAGSSGKVVIRYPSAKATASGGTITTEGSYTVHTFTSNDTFTLLTLTSEPVIPSKNTIIWGDNVIFSVITEGLDDNTQLSYQISGVDSSEIAGGVLSGTFEVVDNQTSININTTVTGTRVPKTLTLTVTLPDLSTLSGSVFIDNSGVPSAKVIEAFTDLGTTTWTAPQGLNELDVLVVAGGGGGGMDMGGGGGAGGVIYEQGYSITGGDSYTVTVGAGGWGAPAGSGGFRGDGAGPQPSAHNFTIPATSGENSVFGDLTAIGGGHGGTSYFTSPLGGTPGNGGSGGGRSGYSNNSAVLAGGTGTVGQGNDGGQGGPRYYSGGGGGAGGPGVGSTARSDGGPGIMVDILGIEYYWGGGGGGSGYTIGGGNGGIGGGGGGAVLTTTGGAGYNDGEPGGGGTTVAQTNTPGGDAGANTGGGGGGGSHYFANNKGGDGGSGIVVLRYESSDILSGPSIAEYGESVTYGIKLPSLADGTTVSYSITGVTSQDISGSSTSGTLTVNSGTSSIRILTDASISDYKTLTLTITLPDTTTESISTFVYALEKIDGGGTLTENDWNHIAVSRYFDEFTFFINGTKTRSAQTVAVNYGSIDQSITIGRNFAGLMRDFHITKNFAKYLNDFQLPEEAIDDGTGTILLTCQPSIEGKAYIQDKSSQNQTLNVTAGITAEYDTPYPRKRYAPGENLGSVRFDDNEFITISPAADLVLATDTTPFTFETWLYPRTAGGSIMCEQYTNSGETIVYAFVMGAGGTSMETNGQYPSMGYYSGSAWNMLSSSSQISLNEWTHVAFVFDGSQCNIYINGTLDSSGGPAAWASGGSYDIDNLYLGRRWDTVNDAYFNGSMADVRFVIGSAVYTENFIPPQEPLTDISNTVLLLNFDDPAVYDDSKRTNVALYNGASVSTSTVNESSASIDLTGTKYALIDETYLPVDFSNDLEWRLDFNVYVESYIEDRDLMSFGHAGYAPFMFYFNDGDIAFYSSSNNASWNIAENVDIIPNVNQGWYKISLRRNNTSYTVHVDDSEVLSYTVNGGFNTPSTRKLALGARVNGDNPSDIYIENLTVRTSSADAEPFNVLGFSDLSQRESSVSRVVDYNSLDNPNIEVKYISNNISSSNFPEYIVSLVGNPVNIIAFRNVKNLLLSVNSNGEIIIRDTTEENDPTLDRNPIQAGEEQGQTIEVERDRRFWF